MLNLRQVRTFLAVIEAGGFRAAARILGVSVSTVADHVRLLEDDLGASLLERRRGSMRPTVHGARFQPLARALVDTAARARVLIAEAPLRLAASSNVGTYLLQPHLAAYRRAGAAGVDLWIGNNQEVAARLTSGGADLAVLERWEETPGFEAMAWRQEPLVLIVSADHPWASRRSLNAGELREEVMLGGERGTGTGALLSARLGPLLNRIQLLDGFGSTEAVKRGVRAGLGVSLVLESAVMEEVAGGTLVALPIAGLSLRKTITAVLPAETPSWATARRLLDHLLAARPVQAGVEVEEGTIT